ncbi:MAG: hypothetical protein JMDDDDMK_03713 [Acidobacteria bacterium]|nr:hypothetical protein [Acidobacteriota bacterium]
MAARREQNFRAPFEIHRAPNAKGFAGAMDGGADFERRIDLDLADLFERRRAVNFDDLMRFDA